MTKLWTAALLLAAAMGLPGVAKAHNDPNNPVGQCIQDAVQTRQSCMQVCRDDFQASVDTCRNVNHTCAEQARQDRQTCVQGVLQSLQQCITTNCTMPQPQPQAAQGHWQGQGGSGGGDGQGECNGDDDGFENFQCKEQCRQTVDVLAGLKACRDAFRTAISQCPTATPAAATK